MRSVLATMIIGLSVILTGCGDSDIASINPETPIEEIQRIIAASDMATCQGMAETYTDKIKFIKREVNNLEKERMAIKAKDINSEDSVKKLKEITKFKADIEKLEQAKALYQQQVDAFSMAAAAQ